ncbi:MAG TPA: F0F1 ATP synthase subunit delta [Candidatus Acidoferrales bacterium]|nr:F0F1 ATP synthase subunit delta [Candidatus Acidoferrales bacterium]
MSNSALFDQIIALLRTTSEVMQVLTCLEELTETFFSSKSAGDHQQVFRKLPKEISAILITGLASEPITPENQISIKRKIDELTDKLRTCKNIQLTIAFQPDEQTITLFSDWIKKNVSPELLIDMQFDKSIVGGAQIIAGGVFKDYTVRKSLANRFRIQRDDIMGLLN